jgi:hypothetical protein
VESPLTLSVQKKFCLQQSNMSVFEINVEKRELIDNLFNFYRSEVIAFKGKISSPKQKMRFN